jgi:hypothetical protein
MSACGGREARNYPKHFGHRREIVNLMRPFWHEVCAHHQRVQQSLSVGWLLLKLPRSSRLGH